MTAERANATFDLTANQLAAIIERGYAMNDKLHRISPRAFRSIVGYIGTRDRPRKADCIPVAHWCDDTLEQIASSTGYAVGGVRDVIALATAVGVARIVRRGGYKTATRRTIDLDSMLVLLHDLCAEHPHLANEAWRGIWRPLRGTKAPKRGADSATPIQNQDIYQNRSAINYTAHEDGASGVDRPETELPLTAEQIEEAAAGIDNPRTRAIFISASSTHQKQSLNSPMAIQASNKQWCATVTEMSQS